MSDSAETKCQCQGNHEPRKLYEEAWNKEDDKIYAPAQVAARFYTSSRNTQYLDCKGDSQPQQRGPNRECGVMFRLIHPV
jgi:hypothetical protein